jgi:hypothetical protein
MTVETEMVIGNPARPLLCPIGGGGGGGGGFYGVGVVDSGGGCHHWLRVESPLGQEPTRAPSEQQSIRRTTHPPPR